VKQTLTEVFLNGLFSVIAVFLVFRHLAIIPLSGNPGLITDFILQTFIATLTSILPPSIMTAKWALTRPGLRGVCGLLSSTVCSNNIFLQLSSMSRVYPTEPKRTFRFVLSQFPTPDSRSIGS
jgi:hypothetical protein